MRRNLAIALAIAALHAGAALAYHGDGQDLPATYFYPQAHAVANGTDAYGGLDYEYPPATLPLLVAPLAAGGDDSGQAYHQRTIWLYGALDTACVLLLAFLLRRRAPIELLLALGLYSVSVLVLGRLALTRFDIAAGIAILLAGYCARSPGRAGAWVGLAGALKLVPLAAAPALMRRGTGLRTLVAAAAVPVLAQVVYALWSGELGLSWIGYHAGRDPEVESWAAVFADVARGLGAHAGTAFDHGSQNVTGTAARWLGRLFALASIAAALLVARRARRADADPALSLLTALATARGARTRALASVPAVARAALGLPRPALPAAGAAARRGERAHARRGALRVRRPAAVRRGRHRPRRTAERGPAGLRDRALAGYWPGSGRPTRPA